jgi:hypothetical protein
LRAKDLLGDEPVESPDVLLRGLQQWLLASPSKIGAIVKAALTLTHFEYGQFAGNLVRSRQ